DTANDKLSKEEIYKKADAIVKIATIADEVSNDENIALMNIRSGNLEKSKIYLKKAMNLEEKETLPPTILDAFDTEMKDMVINCKDLYTNYKNLFDVVFPDIMLVTMVNNNRLVGYFVLRQKVLVNLALLKYNKAKAAKCKNLDETMEKLRQEYSPYFDQPSDLAHNTIQIFFNNIKK
ncbi:MAG: hypothetical protein WCQ47_09215, partial [bacterium]